MSEGLGEFINILIYIYISKESSNLIKLLESNPGMHHNMTSLLKSFLYTWYKVTNYRHNSFMVLGCQSLVWECIYFQAKRDRKRVGKTYKFIGEISVYKP